MENTQAISAEFWTLTYAEEPEKIVYNDFSLFMKRLRVAQERIQNPLPIRYLAVGEYGAKYGRPHFHALIWNRINQGPSPTQLWPHGFVYIGQVTPSSIRYTARYTLKFEAKGREAVANWSKKGPIGTSFEGPLGASGIMQMATYMAKRGDKINSVPNGMSGEGRIWPLDQTMKKWFNIGWERETGKLLKEATGKAIAHLNWKTEGLFGDPIEAERKRIRERNTFYEKARLNNETF